MTSSSSDSKRKLCEIPEAYEALLGEGMQV